MLGILSFTKKSKLLVNTKPLNILYGAESLSGKLRQQPLQDIHILQI